MPRAIRTVVTGHNRNGRSIITADRIDLPGSPNVYIPAHDPNVSLTDIWKFDGVPANVANDSAGSDSLSLKPPKGGVVFRCLEIPPESSRTYDGIHQYFAGMNAGDALDQVAKKHPAMHKTNTIDVLVVLEGEIFLITDEEETLLRAGDCIVQRATNHAWSNRTEAPCILALILVDALPANTGN
jgi:mannose-6-phosphate isomerase-like protein (cupin superfamily)